MPIDPSTKLKPGMLLKLDDGVKYDTDTVNRWKFIMLIKSGDHDDVDEHMWTVLLTTGKTSKEHVYYLRKEHTCVGAINGD